MLLFNDGLMIAKLCKNINEYIEKNGKIDINDNTLFSKDFINRYKPFLINKNIRTVIIEAEPHIEKYIKLVNLKTIIKSKPILSWLIPARWKLKNTENLIKKNFIDRITKYNILIKLSASTSEFEIVIPDENERLFFNIMRF